jgi:type I restriction enzyme S subunit
MKSNYKRLGKYIHLVEERNTALEDLPLMGLSITKKFIPSFANTIGTDMSTYRTIYKNQFAYGPLTLHIPVKVGSSSNLVKFPIWL